MPRIAVVLFNLGGPDGPEAVAPFLMNLFDDPAILSMPGPIRRFVARRIVRRRLPEARAVYERLGGGSPLLANTEAQAAALEAALRDLDEAKVFIAMRYWHPMSDETAAAVAAFAPDEIVLLPLYPQYSTTTTASSLADWRRAAAAAGLRARTRAVCCYPTLEGFAAPLAEAIRRALDELEDDLPGAAARVLLSAHGLPKKVVARGDPYQWQVEASAAAIVAAVGRDGLDHVVCYQSRVGPLEWIGPETEAEIRRAGADRVPVVVVPVAFVSEHSETLVELDMDYRAVAEAAGVPRYVRVATVGTDPRFVAGLAELVRGALGDDAALRSAGGGRLCPAAFGRCAQA